MDGPDGTGADPVEDFLKHFGVKGMKWGVRRKSGDSGGSSSGGVNHPTSADAQAAVDAHNKLKAGGTKALSNAELQSLVKRMQLEQQFNDLKGKSATVPAGKKAAKFLGDFTAQFAKQEVGKILSAIIAKQLKGKIPGLK